MRAGRPVLYPAQLGRLLELPRHKNMFLPLHQGRHQPPLWDPWIWVQEIGSTGMWKLRCPNWGHTTLGKGLGCDLTAASWSCSLPGPSCPPACSPSTQECLLPPFPPPRTALSSAAFGWPMGNSLSVLSCRRYW